MASSDVETPIDAALRERLSGLSPAKRAFIEQQLREQQLRAARQRGAGGDGISRRPAGEPVRLTSAQELLWRIEQSVPGTSTYNVPRAVRVQGPLDVARLQGALNAIVARHEMLRTVFDAPDGEPWQRVTEPRPVELTILDRSNVAPDRREAEIEQLLRDAATVPFDLSRDLLLRATFVKAAPDDGTLLLVSHHIASDGASRDIFFRDLAALYAGDGAEDALPELPELAIQFRDFAAWQREQLTPERTESLLAYWRQQLAGVPARLELPTDYPRPAVPTFDGARRIATLPTDVTEAVMRVSRAQGTTPFMVLLAAFQSLLHRYTAQEDIVVGSVLTGRARPEVEGLVGYFSNTLPLKASFAGDPTFVEVLDRVRASSLGAADHADIPFETLGLELRATSGSDTLFDVMFAMLGDDAKFPSLGDATLTPVPLERGISKFDLTLATGFTPDGLRVVLEYRTDLFAAATIDRMLEHFGIVLRGALADVSARVSALPLLPADELALVTRGWNATDVHYPSDATLVSLLAAQAAKTPERIAVESNGDTLTYAELDARATTLARVLRARGVQNGILVGVCMERSLELMVALIAILKAGGAYVPLDPEYPADRLSFMLSDSGVAVLLTQERLRADLPAHQAAVIAVDHEWSAIAAEAASAPSAWTAATPNDPAYMIYTSGSTGRPKGALNAHAGIVNRLLWMQDEYALGESDVVVQKTPVSFDVSVWELFWPLLTGARLVMAEPGGHRDPAYLADVMITRGVTVLHFVPSMLRAFLEYLAVADVDPAFAARQFAIRDVMCSGEALTYELQERFFARFPAVGLHNLYGPTEAAVDVTYWACVPADPRRTVPIGRPVANTQCYVLDKRLQPVPIGVAGELYLAGVQVGMGYHGRPELTAERFIVDPFSTTPGARLYKTGDLARWMPDGERGVLEYLGRIDTQVKLRGFRIELGEIEALVLSHPDVEQAAVLAMRLGAPGDANAAMELVAYYVPREGSALAAAGSEPLRDTLRQELPDYMVPSVFVPMASIPLMPNGKLDRKALPVPEVVTAPRRDIVAPRTPTETRIAEFWKEVLRVDEVSVHDRFFEVGGHSLLAMRVIGKIQGAFRVQLSFKTFFQSPTIEGLARVVDDAVRLPSAATTAAPLARRANPAEPAPLSYEQQTLWLREQMEPGQAAYNIPVAMRVEGMIDVAALQRAIDILVTRHEALRTTFVEVDGTPMQRVNAVTHIPVDVVDLRAAEGSLVTCLAEANRLLADAACAPFDLAHGPVLRARVVKTTDHESFLILVVHHLVFDGASIGVVLRELRTLYEGVSVAAIGSVPLQQADYAVWQRNYTDADRIAALLPYWKTMMEGASPRLELPVEPGRPASKIDGARQVALFPPSLLDGIHRVARARGATPYMALLATFATVLHRYTGQDDIVIGSPMAGRHRSGAENIVGLLAKALPLRTQFDGDPTFNQLLDRVRELCIGAYEHQDIPYDTLALALRNGRAADDAALFSTLFVLQDGDDVVQTLGGATLSPLDVELDAAKFDIALSMTEKANGLRASLQYRTSLYSETMIAGLLRHLGVLLESIVAAPETPVSALAMVTAAEEAELAKQSLGVSRPELMGDPVHAQFVAQVARTPNAVAVSIEGQSLTYAEVDRRANQVATKLRTLGVGPNVAVALYLERSLELIVAMMGVMKAGGAYVPLDPDYPGDRIAFMLEDASPEVIITIDALQSRLPAHHAGVLSLDGGALDGVSSANIVSPATLDDLAYILYTSGSTGRPKGVMVPHRALGHFIREARELCPMAEGDTVFQKTPITFDPSALECYLALTTGARLLLAKPGGHQDLTYVLETMRRERVSFAIFIPSVLAASITLPEFVPACEALRIMVCGGEALMSALARRVRDVAPHVTIYNMYGPTETTVTATVWKVRGDESLDGGLPIGAPLSNTRAYVLDARLRPVPTGVAGELCIGGIQVARGYLRRDDLTHDRFKDDPFVHDTYGRMYRTGDRVRRRADGTLEFFGRFDEQVKLHGIRLELGEIEAALTAIDGIDAAAAKLVRHPSGDLRLAGYWVPSAGSRLTDAAIREALRTVLPAGVVPSHLIRLEQMPLTSNGKADRKVLSDPTWNDEDEIPYVAPEGAIEIVMAKVWGEVLQRDRVSRDANFFDLGGHSLLATQIVGRVSKLLRVRVPVRSFFEHPTIAGFVARIVADEPVKGQTATIANAVLKVSAMSPEERRARRAARADTTTGIQGNV